MDDELGLVLRMRTNRLPDPITDHFPKALRILQDMKNDSSQNHSTSLNSNPFRTHFPCARSDIKHVPRNFKPDKLLVGIPRPCFFRRRTGALHKKACVFCDGPQGRCINEHSYYATVPLLALRARPDPVSRFRDEVRVMQRPPSSAYGLGRTPAARRRNPRRGFGIKRFLGFSGSRSWRRWS